MRACQCDLRVYEGWGNQGRLYGDVFSNIEFKAWMDATVQAEADALDPAATPVPVEGEQFLTGNLLSADRLRLDILPLTVGDLVGYATREGAEPFSGTTATLPLDLPLDLYPYELEHTGPVIDNAVAVEAQLCTWAMEPDAPSAGAGGWQPGAAGARGALP